MKPYKKITLLFLGALLLHGCAPTPEEDTEGVAPVMVQGERLDAPIVEEPEPEAEPDMAAADPAIDPTSRTTEIVKEGEEGSFDTAELDEAVTKKPMSNAPLNATGQAAVDALVASVTPPISATAILAKKKLISATDELAKATADEQGYRRVPFDILSGYEYMIPTLVVDKETEEELKDQIPNYIMALDDSKVSLEGYMVPLDIEDEKVKSFILTNSMMLCCFGTMPWINEWIYVEMEEDHAADFFNDTVIRVSGVLDVGEEIEDGIVLSLYRMEGHDVESEGKPLSYLFEDYKQY